VSSAFEVLVFSIPCGVVIPRTAGTEEVIRFGNVAKDLTERPRGGIGFKRVLFLRHLSAARSIQAVTCFWTGLCLRDPRLFTG
jgi:hypothetical protein